MAGPAFWADQNKARAILDEASTIRRKLDTLATLDQKISDAEVLIDLGETEQGIATEVSAAEQKFNQFELENLLGAEHDKSNAIFSIHAGAGGTESCDWANMLMRMYQRYCETRGFKVDIVDIQSGDEAGIKSATILVTGEYAYGYLKAERGVHRLVRISPFDSNKRRHTSFASVDVIAELEEEGEIEIPPNEFQVDTFRSGGKGGQNVNKVETAVRITHVPTGLVVASQSQRSQHQNRATAMKLLLSRIFAQRLDAQKQEMERFYGEKGSVSWGNQIRSYVFQPYRMVKDLRTGVQTSDVQGVMDGDLDPFVNGWLRAGCPLKRMQGVKDDEE